MVSVRSAVLKVVEKTQNMGCPGICRRFRGHIQEDIQLVDVQPDFGRVCGEDFQCNVALGPDDP